MPKFSPSQCLGLICALAVLAYIPALQAGFIWDDDAYIEHNRTLESLGGILDIWFESWSIPQYYPLVHTSFWLEYRLFGEWAPAYHLTNLLLHLGSVLLFARLLQQLALPGALLAAGLFALHPVMVESVAWVTERKNVLSMLCYLAAALQGLRVFGLDGQEPVEGRGRRRALGWMYLYFALALSSKSVTFSFPFALLLLCYWKRGRLQVGELRVVAPMVVLGAAYGWFTSYLEATRVGASGAEWSETAVQKLLIAGRVPWFYLSKLVWPQELTFIYERWVVDPTQLWQWAFPLATLLLLAACLVLAWKRGRRGPLTAVLLFGGTLFPALGFISVYPFRYAFVADHFQFHASLSMLALGGGGLVTLARRLPQPVAMAGAGMLLALLGLRSYQQAEKYHDRETLYQSILADNDQAWFAYNNLAALMVGKGEIENARDYYIKTKRLWPKLDPGPHIVPEAYAACMIGEARLTALAAELQLFARTQQSQPDDPARLQAWSRRMDELFRRLLPKLRTAEADFRKALQLNPEYGLARRNLGFLLLQIAKMMPSPKETLGFAREGIRELESVLRREPGRQDLRVAASNGRAWLARLLHAGGQVEQAQVQRARAQQLRAADPAGRTPPSRLPHVMPGVLLWLVYLAAFILACSGRESPAVTAG